MAITITPAENCEMYTVTYDFIDPDEGYFQSTVILSPNELGPWLLKNIPYKPDDKPTLKVVK